jgi:hypothetical protein
VLAGFGVVLGFGVVFMAMLSFGFWGGEKNAEKQRKSSGWREGG